MLLALVAVLLALSIFIPAFNEISASGPPTKTSAEWAMGKLDEILQRAVDAGRARPTSAMELESLVAESGAAFLIGRYVLRLS